MLIPTIGKRFKTIQDGEAFYKIYASTIGFDVRRGASREDTDGTMRHRILMCSRQGFADSSSSQCKRLRVSNRCGCDAEVYIKFIGNAGYEITKYEERHNHTLLQDETKQFLKSSRKMDDGQQQFMINCMKANIGTSMTHRLLKEIMGGYENVGPLITDFKNFKRDLMAFICGVDAQMIIDRFKRKKETCSGYCFAYDTDENQRFTKLFWCDPIARANYTAFGEVDSFDSTYRSNKYNMVFAPFSGMDNHRKSVTFGGDLLLKENVVSYTWLLEHFKEAMYKDPNVLVTDQDPSLKIAVPNVFPNTRHRFCMWHIMMKVPKWVDHKICADMEFRRRLNHAVWSYELTIEKFEIEWNMITVQWELQDNDWLTLMYSLREYWIPAYFRDVRLEGLMRTTSISESANSFFGRFSSRHFTLTQLTAQFDNAMDAQRRTQAKLDIESETMIPKFKTPLQVEKHATDILTLKAFEMVRDEIYEGSWSCQVTSETMNGLDKLHQVQEINIGSFCVTFEHNSGKLECLCDMYNRVGIPCQHIFSTYKYMNIEEMPQGMVMTRWRKDARILASSMIDQEVLKQCIVIEGRKGMLNKLWNTIYSTVAVVENDTARIRDLINVLNYVKQKHTSEVLDDTTQSSCKESLLDKYVGVKPPFEVEVEDPVKAKNKGTRMKGSLENATSKVVKPLRKCARCKKLTDHDKRNCKEVM